MRHLFVLFALTFVVSAQAAVPTAAKAKLFDQDRKNVLYLYDHKLADEGDKKVINNTFTSPDGAQVATEKAILSGSQILSYTIQQKQLGAEGKVEIDGDKVNFSYTRGGKTKTDSEKRKGSIVVGPSLIPFMREKWSDLSAGKEVDIRMAVADRLETVGFTLKKTEDKDHEGKKAVVIRMKPTSFVIAALVKPLHFTLTADGERLLEMKGRVIPKKKDGSDWKDLDAVTVYEY